MGRLSGCKTRARLKHIERKANANRAIREEKQDVISRLERIECLLEKLVKKKEA